MHLLAQESQCCACVQMKLTRRSHFFKFLRASHQNNPCSLANLGKMQFNAPDFAHDLLWIENIDSRIFVKTKNNCQQVIQEIVSKYMNMKVFHTKIALKLGGFIAKIPTRQ